MDMNLDVIKDLIDYLNKSGVGRFRLETGDFKLELEKEPAAPASQAIPMVAAVSAVPAAATVPAPAESSAVTDAPSASAREPEARGTLITSPIVGTYYASPSPEKPPFVTVGQKVKKGDVLFVVESMKLMNEVPSEADGTVSEILLASGSPVEYGQPVLRIE